MPSTVENLSPTRVKITFKVTFSDLEPAIRKAYRDLGANLSIPGFRKGHIPQAMIDARVGRVAVISEAVNAVLPDLYADTIKEHELIPLGHPQIEITKLEDGAEVEFVAEVDVVPDFDLPSYSKIQVSVAPIDDLDQMVAEQIDILRQRFAQVLDVDRPAESGDQIQIDLSAAQDGQVLEDAKAEGLTYIIGSGGMLEGLDEAVTGSKTGDEKTFSSTLAGGTHAGEVADITVVVNKVQSRTLPPIDDDFAQMVSSFDTVEQMSNDLRQAIERAASIDQINQIRNQVLDQVIEMTDFELPPDLINEEVSNRIQQISEELKTAGLTLEDYLTRQGSAETVEQFQDSIRASVERGVRAEILLDRIADKDQVTVGEQDLTNFILQKAQENRTTPQEEIDNMRANDLFGRWMTQIRQSKALDGVVRQVKATDTNGKAIDLSVLEPTTAKLSGEG